MRSRDITSIYVILALLSPAYIAAIWQIWYQQKNKKLFYHVGFYVNNGFDFWERVPFFTFFLQFVILAMVILLEISIVFKLILISFLILTSLLYWQYKLYKKRWLFFYSKLLHFVYFYYSQHLIFEQHKWLGFSWIIITHVSSSLPARHRYASGVGGRTKAGIQN